ncbi:Wzz/FepE/Etk N-terminal domain-containing protein [Alphaproteobacteria bacterium]|nr:Wzz/FepE/Etk N-terminal domain-containing protein [Alphaproteobacteria bacterium]
MSDIRAPYDDKIDLFELAKTLWDGKWLISAFVFVSMICGGAFLLVKDAVYESKVIYSPDTLPPFYGANKASADFQKMFYSQNMFDSWKEDNKDTLIIFEDFSATEVVDGFILSKDEDERLAALMLDKKQGSYVLIKTNQLKLLNDFFNYAIYINDVLKSEYVVRAKDELNILETRFTDVSTSSDTIIQNVLSIDRFIVAANKGADILAFQRPTVPQKVSPKPSLILALSIVLGGMIGVFYILVRNAIRNRREQSTTA